MNSKLALLIDVDQTLVAQEQPFATAVSTVLAELKRTDINPGKKEFNARLDECSKKAPDLINTVAASRRDLLWISPDENRTDEASIADWIANIRLAVWAAILGENESTCSQTKTASNLMATIMPESITPMPGAVEAIALVPDHIKIVAVTNGFASHQRRKLRLAGFMSRIDGVVTSAEVGSSKPTAAPFRTALEMLGITADDAVMVGDSLENDVGGANSLGIDAIQTAGEPNPEDDRASIGGILSVYDAVKKALDL